LTHKQKSDKTSKKRKKKICASLIGTYSYCPRAAWYTYNNIPAGHSGSGKKRLEEGVSAHKTFERGIRKQIHTNRNIKNTLAILVFLSMVGVILWTLRW